MRTALLLVTTMCLVSCSGGTTPPAATPPAATQRTGAPVIDPGAVHEDCVQLAANQPIEVTFDATGDVAFNIHYHEGNDVGYPIKKDVVRNLTSKFVPDTTRTYCLMWTNKGDDTVTVTYTATIEPAP